MVTILGITGGIGSGKSTASQILGELGALVIDADLVGHKIYQPDTPAWREIVETFGEEVVASDGTIDRTKLGPIVFSAPEKLEALNKITHGKIYSYIRGQIDYIRDNDPDRVVAVEPRFYSKPVGAASWRRCGSWWPPKTWSSTDCKPTNILVKSKPAPASMPR